jgi:hypothetical protein
MRNLNTSSPNWQASGENWILSEGGTPIASTTNGIGRTSNIASKNRDLIVTAVNEHAALVAVAEAARNLLNSTPSDNLKTPEQVSLLWKVEGQLQNLANLVEVRNGK